MIKAETKDGVTRVLLKGNVGDLTADTIIMIRGIYLRIKENDEVQGTLNAYIYRQVIKELISDAFIEIPPEFMETTVEKKDDLSIWFDD